MQTRNVHAARGIERRMKMDARFPALYDLAMSPFERRGFLEIRKTLLREARGTVLEIGSGTGINFPLYEAAGRVIAVEPDAFMRARSMRRAQDGRVPITVVRAAGERLPFRDSVFDSVVGTLVFCTIPEPSAALHEVRRVSKRRARLLLFEHVRLDHRLLGTLQDWLTPAWKRICGGCYLNRNPLALIQNGGFEVTRLAGHYRNLFQVIEAVNAK